MTDRILLKKLATTSEKVRNAYLGLGMNRETLPVVFRRHNEDYKKQVGKLKSLRSYW